MKAAQYIYNGLKNKEGCQAVCVDALDYTLPYFKKSYEGGYTFLISKAPLVWKYAFALLDIPWLQTPIRFARRIYNRINAGKLHKYLIEEKFDTIISTQFLSTEVASALKRKGKINAQIITVVTDYDVHRIWTASHIDTYAVACDYTRKKMIEIGVDWSKVVVTGIPCDPKFAVTRDIAALKNQLGLKPDIFTVLVATGSFGMGPIEELSDLLKEEFQVIIVSGHNKSLYARMSQKTHPNVKVLGLVDNMHELMAASDVMVTKPGGLSITEALVTQLPLVFFSAIPGQEEGNVRVLSSYNIGFRPKTLPEVVLYLKTLKDSRDKFLTLLKNTKALAKPNAVEDIVKLVR
jgi:processive 1,2-diacylglycerol beta-glucosyltransferase